LEFPRGDDPDGWLYLAMAHCRLGEKEKSRQWYDRSIQSIEKAKSQDEELRRLRAEAAALLGIGDQPTPKEKENPHAKPPSR
jgi:hypothetical protein